MRDNTTNPEAKLQGKNKGKSTQVKTIFLYLKENIATASMISAATGIPQKNICRYKRDLEDAEKLWEVRKGLCKHTGRLAWYLTTDPDKAPCIHELKAG